MVITKKIIIEYTQREMKRKSKSVTIKKLVRHKESEKKRNTKSYKIHRKQQNSNNKTSISNYFKYKRIKCTN